MAVSWAVDPRAGCGAGCTHAHEPCAAHSCEECEECEIDLELLSEADDDDEPVVQPETAVFDVPGHGRLEAGLRDAAGLVGTQVRLSRATLNVEKGSTWRAEKPTPPPGRTTSEHGIESARAPARVAARARRVQ